MRHLSRGFSALSFFGATTLAIGLLSAQMVLAQTGSGTGRAWSGVTGLATGTRPATAPSPARGTAVTRTGNAGFAQRVGTAVARPASPVAAFPPGVGNVNNPGVAPRVAPGFRAPNTGQGIPNINFPGGTPASGIAPGRSHFEGRRGVHSGRVGGTIVYGVPYAVPYYVPYAQYPDAQYQGDPNVEAAPDGSTTSVYGGAYIPPTGPPIEPGVASFPGGDQGTMEGSLSPEGSMPEGSVEDAQAQPTQPTQPTQPSGSPLQTLLVLKDHTLLLVTNYWLDGDSLTYDLGNGEEASVQISQLDFPLTQQLNRERNVPFILQSRP